MSEIFLLARRVTELNGRTIILFYFSEKKKNLPTMGREMLGWAKSDAADPYSPLIKVSSMWNLYESHLD